MTPALTRCRRAWLLAPMLLLVATSAVFPTAAAAQPPGGAMPDPRQMSGIPLPVADVAAGTVTVRLIKGSLSNPIVGHDVELQGAATLRSKTNEAGRAEFVGLRPVSRVKAVAVVAGERLESQEFEIPSSAGIRVMLVATDPGTQTGRATKGSSASTPQPGSVVLGDQSRFIFEFSDNGMSVFNILQIQNGAGVPIETPEPLIFEIPAEAVAPGLLEGSSPLATLADRQFVVSGPFPPGATLVQFAYSIRYSGDTLKVAQQLPMPMTRLTVLAQKVGATHLTSPQMSDHREMNADGQIYIVGQGPPLQAGDVVTFTFTGLPHAPVWPRNVALVLALVILAAGAWGSMRRGSGPAHAINRRRQLGERRDRLFGEMAALEEQHRAGQIDEEHYTTKRRQLVGALERIYAELDEEAAA